MKIGDVVKFKVPLSQEEVEARFTVVELRGDRVLVEFICDMHIKPTEVHQILDLEVTNP